MLKNEVKLLMSHGACPITSSTIEEMKYFMEKGNCQPPVEKIVCLNPTFVTLKTEPRKNTAPFRSPYQGYFPVLFEEELTFKSNLNIGTNLSQMSLYSYCKTKLQSLVSKLRFHQNRITFHFHFDDIFELCLGNVKMQNKFHVIHCSWEFARCGLANILPLANLCLQSESPESMLLIEERLLDVWKIPIDVSIKDWIQNSACCPFSLIPTLYGVRLVDHVKLGSPVCGQLHDHLTLRPMQQMKWIKVHPNYSSNIKMDVSSPLKEAIGKLASMRYARTPDELLTFYVILQSLLDRCKWVQNGSTLLPAFQTENVHLSRLLTWRTEQAWLNGEPVLEYSVTDIMRNRGLKVYQEQYPSFTHIQLFLAPFHITKIKITDTGEILNPDYHWINLFRLPNNEVHIFHLTRILF